MVKAENTTYVAYEELLEKKIKKNTWRQYWVVLRGDRLVFLSESDQKIAGVIKLTKETTCKVLRRKASIGRSRSKQPLTSTMEHVQNSEDETWKFKLYAKRGVHLLKTNCKSSCDKWTEAISCAVRNLLDYSFDITHSPSLITTGHERNSLKYRLRKNFKYAWTSVFGYVPLGEEEEEEEIDQREEDEVSSVVQDTMSRTSCTRGRWHKRINFLKHLSTRGNTKNYGVLIEDTTDQ